MLTNLRFARLERSMSQFELGIRAEVAPHRISLAERRMIILDENEYKRLANVLGKPLKWILEDQAEALPFGGMRKGRKK